MTAPRAAMRGSRAGLLVACAALLGAPPVFAGKADNSIRMAFTNVLPNVDPYFNSLAAGAIIGDVVWNSLIRRNPVTGAFEPDLATAWRWVDERTLELTLREGVRFHNGEPFGADDVVYTLRFAADPKNRSSRPELTSWIDRIDKVDEHTVRIHAKTINPAAVAMLATPATVIHPHRYYAAVGPKGMSEHPVGTGPFRVVEHALGKSITLARNPDYFAGGPKVAPRVDRVEIRFIPDPTTQVAEIVSGGLDLIMGVLRDQAEQLRERPGLKIVAGDSTALRFLLINTLPTTPAPPLRDLRVRRAIAHAIDRETLMQALQGPFSRMIDTLCHPIQFGCTDVGALRYDYDPAKARALLREAGYPTGFDLVLHAGNPRNNLAEAIANYLDAVGIRTNLRFMETAAMVTAQSNGRVGIVLHSLNTGLGDVSRSPLQLTHSFGNLDVNRDAEIRDSILRGDSVLDDTVRREAYGAALTLSSGRAYVIPLFTQTHYFVATEDLVLTPYLDALPRFYEMAYR